MRTSLKVAALAATISMLLIGAAFAADTVTLPWGDWLGQVLGEVAAAAGTIAVLIVTFALRHLPAAIKGYVDEQRIKQAEQLLQNAISYGANEAKDFVTGQKLDINVGSAVLAEALQYAVDHGPAWLIGWMGGAAQIRDKILARLDLADGISASEIASNVAVK